MTFFEDDFWNGCWNGKGRRKCYSVTQILYNWPVPGGAGLQTSMEGGNPGVTVSLAVCLAASPFLTEETWHCFLDIFKKCLILEPGSRCYATFQERFVRLVRTGRSSSLGKQRLSIAPFGCQSCTSTKMVTPLVVFARCKKCNH